SAESVSMNTNEEKKFSLNESQIETKITEKDLAVKFEIQNSKLEAMDASIQQLKIQVEHCSQRIMKGLKIPTEESSDIHEYV
ncbi:unnamed protein product, partial [Didymodactylos carnosus]